MFLRSLIAAGLLSMALSGNAAAQETTGQLPHIPVLTVDVETLFADSAFGQRIAREFEQRRADLVAEGQAIQIELEAEEKALVVKRKTMEPAAFRVLADAFDKKVQAIREEQDEKARALGQSNDDTQRAFLRAAKPVLEALMREAGAVVILDQRSVFLRGEQTDVTGEAIRRIDAKIGDGAIETVPEQEAPRPQD